MCLHLDISLKARFEFKVEVIFVDRDPLDQPPDHPFVVIRHRLLVLIQRGFEVCFTVTLYRLCLRRGLHLAGEHEPQVIFGVHSQVFDQASPKGLAEVRHLVGQAFQRRDKPLEFPPADAALPDFGGTGVTLGIARLILSAPGGCKVFTL